MRIKVKFLRYQGDHTGGAPFFVCNFSVQGTARQSLLATFEDPRGPETLMGTIRIVNLKDLQQEVGKEEDLTAKALENELCRLKHVHKVDSFYELTDLI